MPNRVTPVRASSLSSQPIKQHQGWVNRIVSLAKRPGLTHKGAYWYESGMSSQLQFARWCPFSGSRQTCPASLLLFLPYSPYDSPTEWIHTFLIPILPTLFTVHRLPLFFCFALPSTFTCASRPSQAGFPLCLPALIGHHLPSASLSPCAFPITDLRVSLLPASAWHLAQSKCLINSVGWMRTERAIR